MHDLHEANKIASQLKQITEERRIEKVNSIKLRIGDILEHGETLNI